MTNELQNTRYLELDFYRTSYRSVKIHQYDTNTRYIIVTVVNDASVFKLNPSTMLCNLKLITSNGRHFLKTQAIQNDGTVLITLDEGMSLISGINKAELNVYELSSNKLLSTMPFDLIVIGSVYDNDVIENTDEFDALTDLYFKSEGILNTVNNHLADENAHGYNTRINSLSEQINSISKEVYTTTATPPSGQKDGDYWTRLL